MRKLLALLLFVSIAQMAQSQIALGLHYDYLNAPQWDNIIRTYNYARPWQKEPQPFLTSGASTSLGWYVRFSRRHSVYMLNALGFAQFTSRANNSGEEKVIKLRRYDFHADLCFNPKSIFKSISAGPLGARLFLYVSPGVTMWQPQTKLAGVEYVSFTQTHYKPNSFAVNAGFGFGYRMIVLKDLLVMSFKAGARFHPNANLPYFANAVQGANVTGLTNTATNFWTYEAGLEFTYLLKRRLDTSKSWRKCITCQ
jgi:hypothetical protein